MSPEPSYVSATPGPYEAAHHAGQVVEQVVRPNGAGGPGSGGAAGDLTQVDDLLAGAHKPRYRSGDRVLVTTLTKRMAEDLTEYLE